MDSSGGKRERSFLQCQWGGLIETLLEQYGEWVAVEELTKIEPTIVERLQALEGCKSLYEVIKVFQKYAYDWPSIEPNADSWMNRINSPLLDQLSRAFTYAVQVVEMSKDQFTYYGICQGMPFHVRHLMYLRMMEHVMTNEAMEAWDFVLDRGLVDLSEYNYASMFGHSSPKILSRMPSMNSKEARSIVQKTHSDRVLDIILESKLLSLEQMFECIESNGWHPCATVVKWALEHGSVRIRIRNYFLSPDIQFLKELITLGTKREHVEWYGIMIADRALRNAAHTQGFWYDILQELAELQIPLSSVKERPVNLNLYKQLYKCGYRATSDVYQHAFSSFDIDYVKALLAHQVPLPANALWMLIHTPSLPKHLQRKPSTDSRWFKQTVLRLLMEHGCKMTAADHSTLQNTRPGFAKLVQSAVQ